MARLATLKGIALIRAGRLIDASDLWRALLIGAPPHTER